MVVAVLDTAFALDEKFVLRKFEQVAAGRFRFDYDAEPVEGTDVEIFASCTGGKWYNLVRIIGSLCCIAWQRGYHVRLLSAPACVP